jgi:hypothetical protein
LFFPFEDGRIGRGANLLATAIHKPLSQRLVSREQGSGSKYV